MNLALLLRAASRRWRRTPWLTLGIVSVLALGIGVVGQSFGSLDAMLVRPLPFADEARLVALYESQPRLGRTWKSVSPANFDDWRRSSHGLQEMAAYEEGSFTIGGDERPERIPGARVSASFVRVMGTAPLMGRGFAEGEDLPGGSDVAVISHVLWRRRFHRVDAH